MTEEKEVRVQEPEIIEEFRGLPPDPPEDIPEEELQKYLNPCDCDNEDSQFVRDHGCCEYCYFFID